MASSLKKIYKIQIKERAVLISCIRGVRISKTTLKKDQRMCKKRIDMSIMY